MLLELGMSQLCPGIIDDQYRFKIQYENPIWYSDRSNENQLIATKQNHDRLQQ